MTDRDRRGLRGPVHTCRMHRYIITTLEFHPDGSLALQHHQNADGSTFTSTYEYESSRLLRVTTKDQAGKTTLQSCRYDSQGRLTRLLTQSESGVERVSETYEYDAAGQKKKTFFVDPTAPTSNSTAFWSAEGTDVSYSAQGTTSLTTLYNLSNQPTQLLFYNDAQKLLTRVTFTYDQAGNLVEEAQEILTPMFLTAMNPAQLAALRALTGGGHKRTHRYDSHGHRIETRTQMGALSDERVTIAYNEHGDRIAEVREDQERTYGMNEEGQLSETPTEQRANRSESRLHYQYDGYGNWITQSAETRSAPDQNFIPGSSEQREITYFDARHPEAH
jgi:hypothetical protein